MKNLLLSISLLFCLPMAVEGQTAALPSLDTLVAQALVYAPSIKELRLKASQQREQLSAEKKSWLSSFRLGLQFLDVQQGYDAATPTTIGIFPSLGGSMQLNFHQLLTTKSRVRIKLADLEMVAENIEGQNDGIAIWMSGKYLDYQQSLTQIRWLQELLSTQEQQLVLVRTRFEKGEGKLEDYMMVQNGVVQTKDALMKAQTAVLKTYQEIMIMTGKAY